MKKIFAILLLVSAGTFLHAQKIDRSKPPVPGPPPVISFGDPQKYTLSNGITVLVVEDHHLPKVSATFSIDQGPITEGDKAGTFGLMGSMLGEGTTSKSKAEFDEAVEQMGANVSLSGSGASASGLTRFFPKAFALMADALRHPAFSQESLDKLKSQAVTGLKAQEKSAAAIAGRVVNALSFGIDHPFGEFETIESVNSIDMADIKEAYNKYVTPSRSYLTFVGDITPAAAKKLADQYLGDWKGPKLTLPKLANVPNPAKTEIDIVDVPSAVQSEIEVVNLIDLPMSDPDYFATRIANQILGGGTQGYLDKNLRETHAYTYGAYSSTGSGRYQSIFSASTQVRNEKADSAVLEILKEIKRIRTEPVSAEDLQTFKALYNGSFALGLENPARTAAFASTIMINKLPEDFYKTYLQKINAVTAKDVERVAAKYFNHDNTRIVVAGKAEVIGKKLEALGYPVHYYDAYAKSVAAPDTAVPAAMEMSAKDVIEKYLAAIGGAAKLKDINTMLVQGEMVVQGMTLPYLAKQKNPNLQVMEVTMNGNPVFRRVYDGTAGFNNQMGNKQDFTKTELDEASDNKGIFSQLYYGDGTYKMKVDGQEKVNGKDAIKLNIVTPSGGEWIEYYDPASGYLVKTVKKTVSEGKETMQSVTYSDYRKTGDIMTPFKYLISTESPIGAQEFNVNVTEVKLNEDVTDTDFK